MIGNTRREPDTLAQAVSMKDIGKAGYLGDSRVVGGLLRTLAQEVLTKSYASPEDLRAAADKGATLLAKVFLGKYPGPYPGPKWNSPGQIDAWVAAKVNSTEKDPVKRLSQALIDMLTRLMELGRVIENEKLIDEQWQAEADDILEFYTNLFLGTPTGITAGPSAIAAIKKPVGPLPNLPKINRPQTRKP